MSAKATCEPPAAFTQALGLGATGHDSGEALSALSEEAARLRSMLEQERASHLVAIVEAEQRAYQVREECEARHRIELSELRAEHEMIISVAAQRERELEATVAQLIDEMVSSVIGQV